MRNLSAVTFLVSDYDEAIAWFVNALGFVLVEDTEMGEGKRWVPSQWCSVAAREGRWTNAN
jgi:catechol 2,3-dioxygenase-like lactoylglutathione lyase family enzyme